MRLLAYSSTAQAGYLLMGVAKLPRSGQGLQVLVYYVLVYYAPVYAATNLAAFAVELAVQRERHSIDRRALPAPSEVRTPGGRQR